MKPTKFQLEVWRACAKIPRGKVSTYTQIAKAIGKPKAVRAVGNALNKNPYSYISKTGNSKLETMRVPCHRVIKSDGSVGGFAHGTKKKIDMLREEGVKIRDGKILSSNLLLNFQ